MIDQQYITNDGLGILRDYNMKHEKFNKYMLFSRDVVTPSLHLMFAKYDYIITETATMLTIHRIGQTSKDGMTSIFYDKLGKCFNNKQWYSTRQVFIKYYFTSHLPDMLWFCDNEYLNVFLTKRDMDVDWVRQVIQGDI